MDNQHLSTGIADLDVSLSGGFLTGRSYLVAGDAGTGKTTACMQFLSAGLKQGEKAVYVTVDERPGEILQAAASLGWDLQSHIQDKSLVILDASPYFSGRSGGAGDKGVDLPKIVSDLAAYANRMEAKRLAIDPVTPLILPGDASARVQDQARLLVHLIQAQLNTTNLFSAHLSNRSAHDLTGGIEEFITSGVLILKLEQRNGQFRRTLSIKKMRGIAVEPAEYPFKIVAANGIVLTIPDREQNLSDEPAAQALEFFELPKQES